MPLIQGKSKEAFSHNVGAEMHSGRPQKQSVAIAYSEKAKAEGKKHLAGGGFADETGLDPDHETMLNECAEECMDAIKNGDRSAFRNALSVLVSDILNSHEDEDE